MNNKIYGKKIKLNELNLTYGKQEKIISVMCFFKYKKDNNLYAICCDESFIPYGVMEYGAAHLKENTLILIGSKNPNQEMIKELLFKIDNKEDLEDFEIQDLSTINALELISPNKLEIKKEILQNIVDKTIPKSMIEEQQPQEKKKKKRILPLLLILIILATTLIYFLIFRESQNNDTTVKSVYCKKEYASTEIEGKVIEDNTYHFDQNDILQYINKSTTYQFYREEQYLDFIYKGLYYTYIPEDNGGFTLDEENYAFIIIEKEDTKEDYFLPTEYEEVLSYYKDNGYSCTEQVEE